jgi:CheY-like chemotaxis protein
MVELEKPKFDAAAFLASAGMGRQIIRLAPKDAFFSQGDPADSVFYLRMGRAKITVVSQDGKEATIALLSAGDFVGEEALAGMVELRLATATAITACIALKVRREEMIRVMHEEHEFSVDDEPLITYTLRSILKRSGLAVLTASNAAEALEIAALVPPDILVTDFTTPETNGIDLALELRRIVPDCKVVLSAGLVFKSDGVPENLIKGADFAILSKPVHPSDLLDCIFERLAAKGFKRSATDPWQNCS